MDTLRDIHPDWKITQSANSVKLERENALVPFQDITHPNQNSIVVTFDQDGARVTEPESTLQITQNASPPECAIRLVQFIDRQISLALKIPTDREREPTDPENVINSLSVIRDLPAELQSQALSLYNQYRDNCGKQYVYDIENTAAAAVLLVERLNGRRTQYADLEPDTTSLFTGLTNIRPCENTCMRRTREIQRALPINIDALHDPVGEIDRVSNTLRLPTDIKEFACELADNHVDCMPEASSYKPQSIAGAAIYNAVRYFNRQGSHKVDFTQSEIATALGCSSAAIRARYKDQWKNVTGAVTPPKIPA